MELHSRRLEELDSVVAGHNNGHPPAHAAGRESRRTRGFRLWSEAPLSSYETWLEIRARSNFRSVEEERSFVESVQKRAPAVIKKVSDFRMFSGEDGLSLAQVCDFLALNKKERRKADVWSHKVHISGNSWNAPELLPKSAVERVLPSSSARRGANQCASELLDALQECRDSLKAFVLHENSRAWELLEGKHGVERLKDYIKSLEPLIDCSQRARELLKELDDVERYMLALCQLHASPSSPCILFSRIYDWATFSFPGDTHSLSFSLSRTHSAWPMVHARQARVWVRMWPEQTEMWPQKGQHRPQSLCNTEGLEAYKWLAGCPEEGQQSSPCSTTDALFAVKYDALRQWVQVTEELLDLHRKMTEMLMTARQRWTRSIDLDGVLRRVHLQELTLSILGFEGRGPSATALDRHHPLPDKSSSPASGRVSDDGERNSRESPHVAHGRILPGSGILACLARVKRLSCHACLQVLPGIHTYAGAVYVFARRGCMFA